MKIKTLKIIGLAFLCATVVGCALLGGIPEPENDNTIEQASNISNTKPQTETQIEKLKRRLSENEAQLTIIDGKATVESIERVLQPKQVSSFEEINENALIETGEPYYFKMRALYKGFDKNKGVAYLQEVQQPQNGMNNIVDAAFGVDTSIYSCRIIKTAVPALPQSSNSLADFYFIVGRVTEPQKEVAVSIQFIHNTEEPPYKVSQFILPAEYSFITPDSAIVPTQEEIMMNMFFGGKAAKKDVIFDPYSYKSDDLFNARVAMNKKNYLNENTFPTLKIKYVSEVVFLQQNGTQVSVSTSDKAVTETMNFATRATGIKSGDKICIYYTIEKNPLEVWDIHAIEVR